MKEKKTLKTFDSRIKEYDWSRFVPCLCGDMAFTCRYDYIERRWFDTYPTGRNVTHWLKPVTSKLYSEDEVREMVEKGFDAGAEHGYELPALHMRGMGAIDAATPSKKSYINSLFK